MIELVRIDTTTGEVTYTGVPTYNVAAGEGRVWFQGFAGLHVSDTHSGYAVEVDPATHQMLRAAAIDLAADHASTPRRRPVGPVAPPRHPTDTRPRLDRGSEVRGAPGRRVHEECAVATGDGTGRELVHAPGGGERRHRDAAEVERTEVGGRAA